jgi:hypothetical protein
MPRFRNLPTEITTFVGTEYLAVDPPSGDSQKILLSNARGFFGTTVVSTVTAVSYTLVLADAERLIERDVATANATIVPPNSAVAFPLGTIIGLEQVGAGTSTVQAGAGVTINSLGGLYSVAGRWGAVSLRYRGGDSWSLVGNLA